VATLAEEFHRADTDVPFRVVDGLLEQARCTRAPDVRQRLYDGELQVALAALQQRAHPVGRSGEFEPARKLDHLELNGGVGAGERLEHFRGMRLSQALGRCLNE